MKKIISAILIGTLLLGIGTIEVRAETMLKGGSETIYIDGVEFVVSITEDLKVQVEGTNGIGNASLIIENNGVGNATISNGLFDSNDYVLDIEELSKNEVELDIYEDNHKIGEIVSVDEIYEDNYEGQVEVAIVAGGVTITLGMLLEALLLVLSAVVIAEVLYISVTKLYDTVQVASKTKQEKVKKYYYPATVWQGQVVVSPKGISKSSAISRVKQNMSVYSFTSSMAKSIITQAGYYFSAPEIVSTRLKGNVYLYHYHKATASGSPLHSGGFHSFYGAPVLGTQ